MESRRRFLTAAAGAAGMSRAVLGANDRVQMAIIGTGARGNGVYNAFSKHQDHVFVAACDVARDRLDQFVTRAGKMDTYTDYRRLLERKDIDAVLITTPDHQHAPILIAACQAGKDAYVEKPISNTIGAAQKMVDAVHKYNRVVQVGLQQRSWPEFQECAKLIQDGYLGSISQVVMAQPGGFASPPEPVQPPPDTLDWEGWQGPAPRHPYKPSRQRRWRGYYDYGGGLITDWGVHMGDLVNWYLKADGKTPLLTSASAQYVRVQNPERDQVPDTFMVSWQYDNFISSFTSAIYPNEPNEFPFEGNYFHGPRGVLLISRNGYQIRPLGTGRGRGGPARMGSDGTGAPGTRGGAQAAPADEPVIEARSFRENRAAGEPAATANHARNFLDCVKSRQEPVCHIDIGFHSTLPCLLGVLAVRDGRSYAWDGKAARPV